MKSAVLSSSDGISHNEEKSINNAETTSLRSRTTSAKPLFEQLRANKDAEQEAQDEFQRSLRGTRLLDDEDCAHLDAVERVREERDREVKSGIEKEVALFKARREDRGLVQSFVDDEGGDDNDDKIGRFEGSSTSEKKQVVKKAIVPKFIVKKKRRQQEVESQQDKNHSAKSARKDDSGSLKNESMHKDSSIKSDNATGLLGLGCYGSDSDSE